MSTQQLMMGPPNAHVVNISAGSKDDTEDMAELLASFMMTNNDCIFVLALGNKGKQYHHQQLMKTLQENSHIADKTIFVANVLNDGKTISPSSSIPGDNAFIQSLTVAAPGTEILSTVPMKSIEELKNTHPGKSQDELLQLQKESMYAKMTGTSMSAPAVTGIVAKLREAYPSLTAQEIVQTIRNSASQSADARLIGHGLVDHANAIEMGKKILASKVIINTQQPHQPSQQLQQSQHRTNLQPGMGI